MNLKICITLISSIITMSLYAKNCDCNANYEWVKKTFEENDAGFGYVIDSKGKQSYEDHNKRILAKVEKAQNMEECAPILYEWLTFFRSGHIAIRLNNQVQNKNLSQAKTAFDNWETLKINTHDFKKYLDKNNNPEYEGIWEMDNYRIGIKKVKDQYIGFIIASNIDSWKEGQVKLRLNISENKTSSTYYLGDHSPIESNQVYLVGKNYLQLGNYTLKRSYPLLAPDEQYEQHFRSLNSRKPYIETLNDKTLYFRIPSFTSAEKRAIDSVINANKDKILATENLIIDIKNGTGGSDASFRELLPFIYTNPIRTVGVEYLSTKLNNQIMLDFIHKPEYGFDENGKKWAQQAYDKLEKRLGEYVGLNQYSTTITTYDTIYTYPKNIGIIINHKNGSTDEQFLLAAKQSKKVKLFGTTTHGVLDISNMYFAASPCNEFQLGYCLSRSMRIPEFTIDEKGIQPDYFLDKSIPLFDWTEYVKSILNEK